jgi:hypothetical protein
MVADGLVVNRPEPGNSVISWPNRSTTDSVVCTRRGSRNESIGKDHSSAKPVLRPGGLDS